MHFHRRALFAFALPLVAVACASPASDAPAEAASQDMTQAWLDANIPPGSALEKKVLGLVNDRTMTAQSFVNECSYSPSQASSLISYRSGDDTISASDDQRFDTLQELDAVPFTDATFWADTVRCAILHTPGPSVCVREPVVVELVVDESGSMNGDKWNATRDSLLALYDRFHATTNESTLVGAMGFDTTPLQSVKPKAVTTEQLEDLQTLVDKPAPHGGGTGLEQALTSGFKAVKYAASGQDARRIVVLLSDGSPSGGDAEKQASLQLVTDARADGIELYAVGIGAFPSDNPSTYDPAFMGQLALAGGTAPASCDPASTDLASVCHVQITPGASVTALKNDLSNALDAIRTQMAPSCP